MTTGGWCERSIPSDKEGSFAVLLRSVMVRMSSRVLQQKLKKPQNSSQQQCLQNGYTK
jgi:hypothetical protein